MTHTPDKMLKLKVSNLIKVGFLGIVSNVVKKLLSKIEDAKTSDLVFLGATDHKESNFGKYKTVKDQAAIGPKQLS